MAAPRRRRMHERGYVMSMVALLLVPFLGFAALVVDVGGWYARAGQVQRAADAAALAAAVWLPDDARARSAALDVARRNGFEDAVNAEVQYSKIDARTAKVEITAPGDVFFARIATGSIELTRSASARYVLPVPLGNPRNVLGIKRKTLSGVEFSKADNFALSVAGKCNNRANGDLFGSFESGKEPGAFKQECYSGPEKGPNPDYGPERYQYVIDLPASLGLDVEVRIWNGGVCGSDEDDGPQLTWTLHGADNTPLNDDDNPQVGASRTATSCGWQTLFTIPGAADRGRWLIKLQRPADGTETFNGYALWARRSGDTADCSTLSDPTCPGLSARHWLPIRIDDSVEPNFYLAEVDAQHAGKEMVITMFDPGEGMRSIQIVDPSGTVVPLKYRTTDCNNHPGFCSANTTGYTSDYPAVGTWEAQDMCLPGPVPCIRVDTPDKKFNNRTLEIMIELPSSYDASGPEPGWWKIRYTSAGGGVSDNTVWGVRVIGDPVHIVE